MNIQAEIQIKYLNFSNFFIKKMISTVSNSNSLMNITKLLEKKITANTFSANFLDISPFKFQKIDNEKLLAEVLELTSCSFADREPMTNFLSQKNPALCFATYSELFSLFKESVISENLSFCIKDEINGELVAAAIGKN